MAFALAVAFAIVAIETSSDLLHRTSRYKNRIANLNQKVTQLKREAAVSEKRLADARREITSRDKVKSIMLAPDLKTAKLLPPDTADVAFGTVAISEKVGGGVLTARGLPSPLDGQVYDAWWMVKGAPPAKAAEFRSALDGTASVYLDPPPPGTSASQCVVTLEPSEGGIEPSGPVKLKAKVGK